MEFSPFKTPFHSLSEDDLNTLIKDEVSEGWYVEFKSDFPTTKGGNWDTHKIAKVISSFANTHGGFYIVGVKCDTLNKASEICGIVAPEKVNFIDQLSKTISSNITPVPPFTVKVITLSNGKYVVVVKVDEGNTPPYITSQGIIYQRESDESNPVKERYILEKFTEKTNSYHERIQMFCKTDHTVSKMQADSHQSFLEIFIFPLAFNSLRFEEFHTDEFFKSIANSFFDGASFNFSLEDGYERKLVLSLGFNTIQNSTTCLTIRPMKKGNMIDKGTIVELHANGALKFIFPLIEFSPLKPPSYYKNSETLEFILDKYCPEREVKSRSYGASDLRYPNFPGTRMEREENDFSSFINCIDGAEIVMTILFIGNIYRNILNENAGNGREIFGLRARGENLWRKFLFFDDPSYTEALREFNLPINTNSDVEIPTFVKGNFFEIDFESHYSILEMTKLVLEGMGLPGPTSIDLWNILKNRIKRFDKESE